MFFYNDGGIFWEELSSKTLLGAKREAKIIVGNGREIEIAVIMGDDEYSKQYETVSILYPYAKKWTNI